MYKHEMSPYLQLKHADRHVAGRVSHRMDSSHEASHLDVGVSLSMLLSHAARHISLSRPVSFFMVKPRLCPSQDQSSQDVPWVLAKSSHQPAASRLEHWDDYCFLNLVPSGFKETPYSLDREHSERRGHGLWLSGYTDGVVTGSDPTVLGLSRGDPTDIAEDDEEEHEVTRAQVLTLSPKSGLGTGFGLVTLGKDDRKARCWTLGPPE
ncbi:hypothetical protein F2Q69_00052040 [Brassica cretica]|uniref:Uncharacterized protein n=1 Tax=Brassica cretica TaxID=69181 RepID=A0A8S9N4X7_BRACR|nr:hypothetical protein F2Q69_00052040 [Brassica cretica]